MTTHAPSRWHSTHIAYHDVSRQDDLLLDALDPLLHLLSGTLDGAHMLRHWRRGPHLRLNVATDPATWADVVRPAIEEIVGSYLRTRPSTAVLDQRALLAQHRVLAVQERDDGPLTPWYPDNSLHHTAYDTRHAVLDEDAAALLADFYNDSTPLLLGMVRHVRQGNDTKDGLALTIMLATAHTVMGPITRSFVSFRSHAESFLSRCVDPASMRAAFDLDYRARREELTGRVRAVIATLDGDTGTPVPFAREWAALMETYAGRAAPLIARDRLIDVGSREQALSFTKLSAFHQLMYSSQAYYDRVFADPAFLRYRVLLNYTYLHNTRLGLTPPARFRLCHLAAGAVEEVYDVSAFELIRAFVEAHP
ncbi:thiopeptide maturation pyridine synthase [Nonomuraea sp. NPDC026600]|uniref:thiopeptide maturation pyridine synthase n=1 Tax=Nonomuraea sp. NPDC026600 TaxID=3155363 RepID=UPI0033D3A564